MKIGMGAGCGIGGVSMGNRDSPLGVPSVCAYVFLSERLAYFLNEPLEATVVTVHGGRWVPSNFSRREGQGLCNDRCNLEDNP